MVAGVDYSESGDLALEHALRIAADRPLAEVHAVNVLASHLLPRTSEQESLSLSDATAKLTSHLEQRVAAFRSGRGESSAVRPKIIVTVPSIQPPCSECVKSRQVTAGDRLWCEQHRERHGQRHVYHGTDRISRDGSMPLVFHG